MHSEEWEKRLVIDRADGATAPETLRQKDRSSEILWRVAQAASADG